MMLCAFVHQKLWNVKEPLCTLAGAGFAVMLAASPALAQIPLKVLADGPPRPGLIEIGRTFYRDSGQQVDYAFGASPNILARVEAGEAADVLIVQPEGVRLKHGMRFVGDSLKPD